MTFATEFTATLNAGELVEIINAVDMAVEHRRRLAAQVSNAGLSELAQVEHDRIDTLSTAAAKLRHAELVASVRTRSAA